MAGDSRHMVLFIEIGARLSAPLVEALAARCGPSFREGAAVTSRIDAIVLAEGTPSQLGEVLLRARTEHVPTTRPGDPAPPHAVHPYFLDTPVAGPSEATSAATGAYVDVELRPGIKAGDVVEILAAKEGVIWAAAVQNRTRVFARVEAPSAQALNDLILNTVQALDTVVRATRTFQMLTQPISGPRPFDPWADGAVVSEAMLFVKVGAGRSEALLDHLGKAIKNYDLFFRREAEGSIVCGEHDVIACVRGARRELGRLIIDLMTTSVGLTEIPPRAVDFYIAETQAPVPRGYPNRKRRELDAFIELELDPSVPGAKAALANWCAEAAQRNARGAKGIVHLFWPVWNRDRVILRASASRSESLSHFLLVELAGAGNNDAAARPRVVATHTHVTMARPSRLRVGRPSKNGARKR